MLGGRKEYPLWQINGEVCIVRTCEWRSSEPRSSLYQLGM